MRLEADALKMEKPVTQKVALPWKEKFREFTEDDRKEHVPARLPDTRSSSKERLSSLGFLNGCLALSLFSSSTHLSNVCFAADFTRRSS